jgi:hypothetical protein
VQRLGGGVRFLTQGRRSTVEEASGLSGTRPEEEEGSRQVGPAPQRVEGWATYPFGK